MAHKKSASSAKSVRDSEAKRLGVKLFGGQIAKPGAVIVRQRGTKFIPGKNVGQGKDDTLYSLIHGRVVFRTKRKLRFDGSQRWVKIVEVEPL